MSVLKSLFFKVKVLIFFLFIACYPFQKSGSGAFKLSILCFTGDKDMSSLDGSTKDFRTITFSFGGKNLAHRCESNTELLEEAVRFACCLSASTSVRMLRGGIQLDPTTPAALLGGCTVLVLACSEADRCEITAGKIGKRFAGITLPWGGNLVERWFRSANWMKSLATDFLLTIFIDVREA
jgi:hypothetical protein